MYFIAAGKNIDGSIAVFGPSMYGEVAFLNDDHAGHTLGRESMKAGVQDMGLGGLGGLEHGLFDQGGIVEQMVWAAEKLGQDLYA